MVRRRRQHDRPIRGGRFINEARLFQMQTREAPESSTPHNPNDTSADLGEAAHYWLKVLDDPATRRIVVDPDAFLAWTEKQGDDHRFLEGPVHAPFEQMWIEFTRAPDFFEADPGRNPDRVLGILMCAEIDLGERRELYGDAGSASLQTDMAPINFFVREDVEPMSYQHASYGEKVFYYYKETGQAVARFSSMTADEGDRSVWKGDERAELEALPDEWLAEALTSCRPVLSEEEESEGSFRGFFERWTYTAAGILTALLAYMTDTSVVIIEEDLTLSRQQRRANARNKKPDHVPESFHLVYARTRAERISFGDGERRLSYRFDVRGHYRRPYTRKGKEGKRTMVKGSWVTPHQKGPGIYIPSTHVFEES